MCQKYLAAKHRTLNIFIKTKKLNMAKKTYLSPGIMLLQIGGDGGADIGELPYTSTPHDDELAKPGQFEDFDDDDEAYRTLW